MSLGFLNRCIFRAAGTGTGSFVVSSAITGYLTPAQADAVNTTTYRYVAESDDKSQWEFGYGVYTTGDTTLTRATILKSSNSNNAVNFSAAPKVHMGGPLAGDMQPELVDSFTVSTPVAGVSFASVDMTNYSDLWFRALDVEVDVSGASAGPEFNVNDEFFAFSAGVDSGGKWIGFSTFRIGPDMAFGINSDGNDGGGTNGPEILSAAFTGDNTDFDVDFYVWNEGFTDFDPITAGTFLLYGLRKP